MTCVCDHLTSFGVMMDFSNEVKADDPGKFIFNSKQLIHLTFSPGQFLIFF